MGHTPGKWKVGERDKNDNQLPIIGEGNPGAEIARVMPLQHYDNRQVDNAALIVAAPKMFKALKRLTAATDAICAGEDTCAELDEAHWIAANVIAEVGA